jgi:DNA-directed RNA polymerase subunit N (RpoN/RPB10)
MLFLRCPTCKQLLGHIQIDYEEKLKEICNSDKTNEKKEEEKQKLILSYHLRYYCCPTRLATYTPLIEIIK